MNKFSLLLSRSAEKTLDAADRPTEARLRARLKQIEADPFDARFSKPLAQPKGFRSSRVGGWRIVFLVDTEQSKIEVQSIASRGQVYRGF